MSHSQSYAHTRKSLPFRKIATGAEMGKFMGRSNVDLRQAPGMPLLKVNQAAKMVVVALQILKTLLRSQRRHRQFRNKCKANFRL